MTKFWKLFLLVFIFSTTISCSDDDKSKDEGGEEEDTEVTIKDIKPGMNLVGIVSDGKTPVIGAVVSDGYTTTTTDKDGIYQLKANLDSASFVFVSVPAEYEIPLDAKGIPQMYKKVTALKFGEKKIVQRNFSLVKTSKKSSFTLVALADVQIANANDLKLLEVETPKIKAYIESLGQPIYGISLGDLVWDNMPFFGHYRNEISKLGIPVFQVIGNHDHDKSVVNDDLNSALQYEKFFGPTYYSYNIGDCHFVVLDDVFYEGEQMVENKLEKKYSGKITESQLNWLKQDLSHVGKDKLIILGTHIPTKRRVSNTQVSNNVDLYKLLEGYKVRILSGHSHYNYTTTISANIEENTHGAVMGEFWTGDFCNDGSPKGFSVYQINGTEINNWYYKGTDHDKSYQMRVYAPGNAITSIYSKDVLINIFTWHTNWTVKVTEDNKPPVEVTSNIKEYDPLAHDYLGGKGDPKKPIIRPDLAEAIYTDHILRYTPKSTKWKVIKVEATDPYGNVYKETITQVVSPYVLEDNFSWITTGPNYLGGTSNGGEVRFDDSSMAPAQKSALDASGWTWNESAPRVYMHTGYVKIGTAKDFGVLISPALSDLENNEDVEVSFDASKYRTSETAKPAADFDVILKIVDGTGVFEDSSSARTSMKITGDGKNMQRCSFVIKGASAKTKFSIQNGESKSTDARMFLDNVIVSRK